MHKGLKRYIMAVLWGGGAGLAWLTAWLVLGVVTQSPRLREVFAATDFVHRWAFGFCQYLTHAEVLSVHDAFAVYFRSLHGLRRCWGWGGPCDSAGYGPRLVAHIVR